ncbi:MAG TPA: LysR family transcriptional regulator [Pseudobdellovibrionaceae bacterium]|nr:LysR family transcriptional regulator [Pseudobdellovibrionaceae bacterium]
MLNLHQLHTFVTVISEGSMTAAAGKLYLTQPAVSQQIRNLEEEVGVELLVRGVRQIKATPQGEILYEHSKRILQQTQQAEIAVRSMGAELKGHMRIGTMNSIGLHIMSPIVSRLMRHNPDLRIRVDYLRGEELLKGFKKGQFDVVIMPEAVSEFGTAVDGSVEGKFLLKEEMWLVSSGKDSEVPQQINASELGTFPLVNFIEEFPGFQKKLQEKMAGADVESLVIFESSNVGTLKRVIESGLGWGFLPAHSVKKQVRSGRLNRTHVKDFHYEIDLMFYDGKQADNRVLCETFYQAVSQQEKA